MSTGFSELKARARERCFENISRAYPLWQQVNLLVDGNRLGLAQLAVWREANKAYLLELLDEINDAARPEDVSVDLGWPDPSDLPEVSPADVPDEPVVDPAFTPTITPLATLAAPDVVEIDEAPAPASPEMEELLRESKPYGDGQAGLRELYVEIQNLMMMGLATPKQMALHSRIHTALDFGKRKNIEIVG